MYRDVAQWSCIRDRVLRKGVSIRRVARETGISPKTVRKMLDHPLPQPYRPRSRRYPKLGPHTGSIQRMLEQNATLPPSIRLSIKAIYERIRDKDGFHGSYSAVKDYAHAIAPESDKGRVSRAPHELSAARNCTRDEGGPFEFGDQEPISSHRKLLRAKAVVVSVAETPGHDFGRHGRERRAQANRCRSVESGLDDVRTGG